MRIKNVRINGMENPTGFELYVYHGRFVKLPEKSSRM